MIGSDQSGFSILCDYQALTPSPNPSPKLGEGLGLGA
jgi:hypothetical protein